MLKLALSLLAGLLLFHVPAAAATTKVRGIYVHQLNASSVSLCTREEDIISCSTLRTRQPEAEGFCSANVMRNIIALTKSEEYSEPIPPDGFVNVSVLSKHLKKNRISVMSGELFPCSEDGPSFFQGTVCLDTTLRDGIYEYDHCILAYGQVSNTPAADSASKLTVSGVTSTGMKVCEALDDNRSECYRLEAETKADDVCEYLPAPGWRPFSRFVKFMRTAEKDKATIYMGAAPCRSGVQSATACVLQNEFADDWLFCTAVRILPAE